jgi:hypothetical protein
VAARHATVRFADQPGWFGYVKPGPSNTGPTDVGALVAATAAEVEAMMDDDAVIEDVAITGGTVDLGSHNNVTIRNFTHDATGDIYAFRVNGTGRGLILEDGEIFGMSSAAVLGPSFTARRLNIHDSGNDAFKPQPSGSANTGDVLVESCYLHVLGTEDDAHGDGCQIQATHTYDLIFRGNNFDLPRDILPGSVHTSCFIVDEAAGSSGSILIQHNWLNGGQATIYAGVPNNISVIENRFGRDYGTGLVSIGPVETWTGNVWDDDDTEASQ